MQRIMFNLVLITALWLGVQTAAHAENTGWYLGFNMGSADVKLIDESDLGYKFYGGYMLQNFGFELAFVGLGDGYTVDNVDIYGMSMQFIGRLPLGTSVSLLGKVGLFWWTVSNCYYGYYYYDCYGGVYDDGSDLTYGVGMQFDLSRNLSLRAEYEEFVDVSRSDVSLLSLGVIFRF